MFKPIVPTNKSLACVSYDLPLLIKTVDKAGRINKIVPIIDAKVGKRLVLSNDIHLLDYQYTACEAEGDATAAAN